MIYELSVDKAATLSLPDILRNLRAVFCYIINVAKSLATSKNDGVRIYFSRAPSYSWSTSVMFLHELTVDRLIDIFKRHLQSNKKEILKKGWQTDVSIFVFDNNTDVLQRKNKRLKTKKANKYLKYDLNEGGEMARGVKLSNPIFKYGREVRKGVFSIRNFDNLNKKKSWLFFSPLLYCLENHICTILLKKTVLIQVILLKMKQIFTKEFALKGV